MQQTEEIQKMIDKAVTEIKREIFLSYIWLLIVITGIIIIIK